MLKFEYFIMWFIWLENTSLRLWFFVRCWKMLVTNIFFQIQFDFFLKSNANFFNWIKGRVEKPAVVAERSKALNCKFTQQLVCHLFIGKVQEARIFESDDRQAGLCMSGCPVMGQRQFFWPTYNKLKFSIHVNYIKFGITR